MEQGASKDYPLTDIGEEQAAVMRKRHRFVQDFCKKCGWDPKQLSFEQELEIRKIGGWKNLQ
jgi:hypothetical protein